MPLTDTTIRNAKPDTKPVRMFDGGGLYLEISPFGGKLWRLKYRFGGKENALLSARTPLFPGARDPHRAMSDAAINAALGMTPKPR